MTPEQRKEAVEWVAREMAERDGREWEFMFDHYSVKISRDAVYQTWFDRAETALTALEAYLAEVGLVTVPVEPTDKMFKKAFAAMNDTPSGTWRRMKVERKKPREIFDAKMLPRWQAMIAAHQQERDDG